MKVIRFPRTDEATVNSVSYWCVCNLSDGFRVRHDNHIGTNEKGRVIFKDDITIKTFSKRDFERAKLQWQPI